MRALLIFFVVAFSKPVFADYPDSNNRFCELHVETRKFGDRFYAENLFVDRFTFRGAGSTFERARSDAFSSYLRWSSGRNYFDSRFWSRWSFGRCW